MAYKAFLEVINERIKEELDKPAPVWYDDEVSNKDMRWIEQQGQDSQFDVGGLRSEMIGDLGKNVHILAKSCSYGRVIVLHYGKQLDSIWDLWGRILRLFGLHNVRIVWFAHPKPRLFPLKGQIIGPVHVNGGYCMPCNPNTIIIYRKEDAARVLIHELLHAACTDDKKKDIQDIEAETEAWAELWLAQLIGGPNGWKKQRRWMRIQNIELAERGIIRGSYPWRYTIGKELVWDKWGFPSLGTGALGTPKSLKLGAY